MTPAPDTRWTDDEIILASMTPDTEFVFARMTEETIVAVNPQPGEHILDVACGRAIDALSLSTAGARLYGIEASGHMIQRALEYLGPHRGEIMIVHSLAEALPFADNSFDKVLCKGALDHFADLEKSMTEMTRVLRPGGKLILALANYESLACRLGRVLWGPPQKWLGDPPGGRKFWEPPADHNFKFDLHRLQAVMGRVCAVERVTGVSLFWGFPKWGAFLRRLPSASRQRLLSALDYLGQRAPALADVIVARGVPRK